MEMDLSYLWNKSSFLNKTMINLRKKYICKTNSKGISV